MRLPSELLLLTLTAAPAISSIITPRSASKPGRFEMKLERRARGLTRRDDGDSAVGTIYNGTDWVTSVNLGGQKLILQIDTGSADLWAVSTLLPEDFQKTNLSSNHIYDPTKSKTWKKLDDMKFNITYDVGELGANGIVGTETIDIGGATVTEMQLGLATDLFGQGIIDKTYDGTIGLGWQSQNTIQTDSGDAMPGPTFMGAVQPTLEKPLFTADFKAAHAASLSFGFVNDTLYTGQLVTLPINNGSSFWSVDGVTFSSNGKSLGNGEGINVLMDTGGVGTTTDPSTARDYWQQVDNVQRTQGEYIFPCDTKTLPDLTLEFGTAGSATISGAILNMSATDLGDGSGYCLGGVQPTENGSPNAGFGFFSTYFTVWDQSVPSLSFAKYSNVDDTAAENDANLPAATDSGNPANTLPPGGQPTATSSGTPNVGPTVGSTVGWSLGMGLVVGGVMASL